MAAERQIRKNDYNNEFLTHTKNLVRNKQILEKNEIFEKRLNDVSFV